MAKRKKKVEEEFNYKEFEQVAIRKLKSGKDFIGRQYSIN